MLRFARFSPHASWQPCQNSRLAPLVGEISDTETDNGLDIVVESVRSAPATLAAFARQAPALGVARLTVGGESITTRAATEVDLPGVKVKLPPGTFLQASRGRNSDDRPCAQWNRSCQTCGGSFCRPWNLQLCLGAERSS